MHEPDEKILKSVHCSIAPRTPKAARSSSRNSGLSTFRMLGEALCRGRSPELTRIAVPVFLGACLYPPWGSVNCVLRALRLRLRCVRED